MIKGSAKIRITVDIDNWETSPWAEALAKAIEIKAERSYDYFELSFEPHEIDFNAAAKKIAKEAIEAFFDPENRYVASATPEGIKIAGDEDTKLSSVVVIPWNSIFFDFDDGDPRPAIKKWIADADRCGENED